jgi:hypothetical protein
MDRILGDSEFQSVFSKPELTDEYNRALAQDAGYRAFVRVASKKEDDGKDDKGKDGEEGEVGKDDKKKKSKARPPWLKGKKGKKEAALALEYIVENLNKTSEVLDNLGFNKSATVALALINGIYREASVKLAIDGFDDGMSDRVSELNSKNPGDIVLEEGEEEEGEEGEEEEGEEREWLEEGGAGPLKPKSPAPKELSNQNDEHFGDDYSPFPLGQADDIDSGNCGSMMASASDKSDDKEKAKKTCASEVKKLMKKHHCSGAAKVTEKGVEVTCKGEKDKCDKCCKEIHALCKKHKVSCKLNKEYTDNKEKKAFVIRNKAVIAAMNELENWIKEG